MEKQLQQFLDKAFAPYGDFPARAEVTKELLTNLVEKYHDLKKQGMSDDEAYRATIDSFGDVEEIMEQVPHSEKKTEIEPEHETSLHQTIKMTLRRAKSSIGISQFAAVNLKQSDLSDTNLSGVDFSYSALMETVFDGSDLSEATFRAAALKGTSFDNANLTKALFAASDLQDAKFHRTNLTETNFKASALHGATFESAILFGTDFRHSDLAGISFDNQELEGVIFNSASLKKTSFRNTTLHNVSFHHADVKHAIFDGAKMDKVTYALLKGAGSVLDNVTII